MKRDMDLVRKILLAVEASENIDDEGARKIEGYSDECVAAHAYLMKEAGLIDGPTITTLDSSNHEAIANRLTWEGHEFLDLARSETMWSKAKAKAASIASGGGLAVFKAILTELTKQAISDQ